MSEYRTCGACGCYLPDGETQCRACGEWTIPHRYAEPLSALHGYYTREPLDRGWTESGPSGRPVPTGMVKYVYATDIVDGEEVRYRVKV